MSSRIFSFFLLTALLCGIAAPAQQVITLQPGSQITLSPGEPTTVICSGQPAPGAQKCICRYNPRPGTFSYELVAFAAIGHPVPLERYFDRASCVQGMIQAPECK